MKRLLALLLVLPLAGFRPAPMPPAPLPEGQPVRLSLLDRDSGQLLPAYPAQGQYWVPGERGHRYAVRLYNDSPRRVLVVLSVDGVNAISGQTAAPDQTGYVLNPWQSADITGWRKSQDEVAQFVFSTPGGSYASRTDRPDNVGVVGIAVFNERPRSRLDYAPIAPAAPAPPAPVAEAAVISDRAAGTMARAARPAPSLGTGHGEREASSVRDTDFQRDTRQPIQVAQLRYDSVRNLRARGIILTPPRPADRTPQAFPQRYVPDPPLR
ncbi:hypothetical protein [Stenotrophomonas sp. 24(2023)]|uniref:hypothetical protein n=1 Tax=Stenotrophomonas sp. 24(2023) TaxID=3068324 RepID=UPI0027E17052|nr:hypothetical protein [Stenotrophomonas sp. 24(2023)]WMJ71345.1 hypothetical protein Q9R17_09690 [Stenotrophomonas sp. 24(2023)]